MSHDWLRIDKNTLDGRLDFIKSAWDHVKHTLDGKLFLGPPGQQHYHLLAYITSMLPEGSRVLEIGTRTGESAIAMKIGNPSIKLTTCDLEDNFNKFEDIDFRKINGLDLIEEFKDAPFIFIDVDPHDGVQERVMIQKLKDVGFKGVLMLDDIRLNQEMFHFWNEINLPKIDVSLAGHYSGTGIVLF